MINTCYNGWILDWKAAPFGPQFVYSTITLSSIILSWVIALILPASVLTSTRFPSLPWVGDNEAVARRQGLHEGR